MSRGSHISAYAPGERHQLPGYGDRFVLKMGTNRASCPILACYEVYLFLSFPQKHPAQAVVGAGVCSTGMPAWPHGLLPSRGARASPVPALETQHIIYPESFSTSRGHVLFLASFISISSMMSQRAMICNRKEQKQAWRVRKRLERSGYWCEGSLCGRSTAHRVLEAGSDSSPSPFGNAVGPRRSWERELGSRALLGLQRRVSVSWFCCSTFAGGICVKKSLSSPKTVANAYAAIIYFI